ncbi:hypothetical protein Taro_055029 [Colocasia esculenta]|uniref:Beta-galactosidase n=1 Tax=Colocasia esculenta TaxID=4460 RepID=A0A843XQ94_COLES|nr:hypothetical protein [Colocasia esculenta]
MPPLVQNSMTTPSRRELCAMWLLCLMLLLWPGSPVRAHDDGKGPGVTYDGRSLIVNGKRGIFFAGAIHYPRSTPEMWPGIIAKAKQGGLNVIQTYVFWNIHEPQPGQFNFEGRYDLVKFIKLIQQQGMYVTLRIGPFIEAEWNFGGFPFWLRQKEKLYASQGGPIILSQIENEYNMIMSTYQEEGVKYVQWAAKMAVGLQTGVPWVMCKQKDAPDPVINTCNGRNCGDTFTGPNSPTKPSLWTENWTAQYRVFGDPPSQRSAEDLAFSVARFFAAKNGTLATYYMYHGGTNFGRTSSALATTRYYDEAPLDEYGLQKEPKWGHIKDLHVALKLCRKALLWGAISYQALGKDLEAHVYEKPGSDICVAFLTNKDPRIDSTVQFRGAEYFVPHRSISILPDCKTVVFNTQRVNSQHNARTYHLAKESNKNAEWKMYQESVPTMRQAPLRATEPMELMNLTKDETDYLWYTTRFNLEAEDLPRRHDTHPVVLVSNLGHAMHAFVNDVYVGSGNGNKMDKSFTLAKPAQLKAGTNHISLLAMTVGLPNSGVYLERRMAGVHTVAIQGLNTGTLDLSANGWGHKVGLSGEKNNVFTEEGSRKVQWSQAKKGTPLTWYKRYFDAPRGDNPVAVDMTSMAKGMVWINGESIGRYWVSFLSPLGMPTQTMYHIPRAFLKPKDNLMIIFEETGGNPEEIVIITARRDNICSVVADYHPAHVKSWARQDNQIQSVVQDVKPRAELQCPDGKVISAISFASFGNPTGICGNLVKGSCDASSTKSVVEKACLGNSSCKLPVNYDAYGADPACPGTTNTLAVQAKCTRKKGSKA